MQFSFIKDIAESIQILMVGYRCLCTTLGEWFRLTY